MAAAARWANATDGADALLPVLESTVRALAELKAGVDAADRSPRAISEALETAIDQLAVALTLAAERPHPAGRIAGEQAMAAVLLERVTRRERGVLAAVAAHGTTARAADALAIGETTLGHHRSNILRKLGCTTFAQAGRLLGLAEAAEARGG